MAGNPSNVNIWDEADVYVLFPDSFAPGETIEDHLPATIDEDMPAAWDLVGLLDGDGGFGESRDWDSTDHFAWGFGKIKVSRRNFAMQRTFTALEENATTDRLYSPGDTLNHVRVQKPAEAYFTFELRNQADGRTKRLTTTMPCPTTAPEKNENESDLASKEFTVDIFPNSNRELFIKQDATNSVGDWTVTVTGTPTAAEITFRVNGDAAPTTLSWTSSTAASAVKAVIDTIPLLVAAGVTSTVSGSAGGPYTVTVPGVLSATATFTGGTAPAVTVVPA